MKTRRKFIPLAIASVAFVLSQPAVAGPFSYDYLSAGAFQSELKFGVPALPDSDLQGFLVMGSFSVTDTIVVGGTILWGASETDARFNDGSNETLDLDITSPTVFAMYHAGLIDKADIGIGVSFTQTDFESTRANGVDVPELSGDSDSKAVFGQLRYLLSTSLELAARVDYDVDADDGEDEIGYELDVRYRLSSTLDAGLSFSPSDDGDTFAISARKYLF